MAEAAPTGCFKCGRPGHWSRDCPSSGPSNPNPSSSTTPNFSKPKTSFPNSKFSNKSKPKPKPGTELTASGSTNPVTKKKPRSRPNLTADMLLSDDGLGYVLKHFPRGFKCRGRGHEVSDLGNLIGLYSEWHMRLIPYYSFDQFVHKVEQVGASKRVRRCIGELRDRVARGGDPTKLLESPVEEPTDDHETDGVAANGLVPEPTDSPHENPPVSNNPIPDTDYLDDPDDLCDPHDLADPPEDMLDEIYHDATEESETAARQVVTQTKETQNMETSPLNDKSNESAVKRTAVELTEEQRARMEANRLKALERAKTRALAAQTPS